MTAGRDDYLRVCPFCFKGISNNGLVKYGLYRYRRQNRQKWLCRRCGKVSAFPLVGKPKKRGKAWKLFTGHGKIYSTTTMMIGEIGNCIWGRNMAWISPEEKQRQELLAMRARMKARRKRMLNRQVRQLEHLQRTIKRKWTLGIVKDGQGVFYLLPLTALLAIRPDTSPTLSHSFHCLGDSLLLLERFPEASLLGGVN